jgi:hypothetical protein
MSFRLTVLLTLALLSACAPPLSVTSLDQRDAYRLANRSALSADGLSVATLTTLRRHALADSFDRYPDETIAVLHSEVVGHPEAWQDLFALAELSYLTARREESQPRYMAAAVYAYAFLFPDRAEGKPDPFDPRFRQACDLYNLSLTAAVTQAGGDEVALKPGPYILPFGAVDITLDEASLNWGERRVIGLVPTSTLEVKGVVNQYRTPGLGAAMAARVSAPPTAPHGFQVAPRLRVPATLLLRIPTPRQQLATGHLSATLTVYNSFDSVSVTLGGRQVPLAYDETAARAISLTETKLWNTEISGFLEGTAFDNNTPHLLAIEPHRRGRIPIVLVHGTASSPFRWSDMVNDLLEDPRIQDHFEFWLFSYATGNPIPYSAAQLRAAINQATAFLGGTAVDPALGHMVLIGHSQGGLLVKMQVIDPGDGLWNKLSRRPLDALTLDQASRKLLQDSMFPAPLPQVDRVIFISTPHRGAYAAGWSLAHLAARLVTLPLAVTKAGAEILTGNKDALAFDPSSTRIGATFGMTPGSPLIKALAATPVVPGVHAHSIIPILGDGPPEDGEDGVVRYQSAHIDGVDSELVVPRSGHSTQANPLTIAEVRRILLIELASVCGGQACDAVMSGSK